MTANGEQTGGEERSGRHAADELMALLVAQGKPLAAIAEACSVSERTVSRRLADAEFKRLVGEVRSRLFGEVAGRLTMLNDTAVTVMKELMEQVEHPQLRYLSAKAVLDASTRFRELCDLDARLAALEEGAADE